MADLKLFKNDLSRSVERSILATVILLLIFSNLMTVANSTFQQSLHGLLSLVPVEGVMQNSLVNTLSRIELQNQDLHHQVHQLHSKWESHQTKANSVTKGVVKRSARNALKNVTSVFGEAIPYLGTALIVSVTADDVIDACDTIRDMNEMAALLETEGAYDDQNTVCGTKVPSADEVVASVKQNIGISISQAQEQSKESARILYDAIGGTVYQMLNK